MSSSEQHQTPRGTKRGGAADAEGASAERMLMSSRFSESTQPLTTVGEAADARLFALIPEAFRAQVQPLCTVDKDNLGFLLQQEPGQGFEESLQLVIESRGVDQELRQRYISRRRQSPGFTVADFYLEAAPEGGDTRRIRYNARRTVNEKHG